MIILIQPKAEGYSELLNKTPLPLALLNCARLLDKESKIKLIDQRLTPDWKNILLQLLKQNPVCVGVTSVTGGQIRHALEVSRFVKENSDVSVVWGGVHASLLPGQTLENPFVDVVVKGEGEVTFCELVNALKNGKSLKGIKGVWYKKDGKICNNPDRPFINLNKLPELPYHLINIRDYIQKGNKKILHVQTSRGCPHSCNFCYNQSYHNNKLRTLSLNKILEDMLFLKDFGANHFWIIDDNFFTDFRRARSICSSILKERLDITWEVPGSNILDISKFNNFNLLERSGCEQLYFGVESGSNQILKYINKGITRKQVLKFNQNIEKSNIRPWYNFMVGFPNETKKDINSTLTLILELLKENKKAMISPIYSFTPYPGTKLFDASLKHGFIPPSNLEWWGLYDWKTINIPWITKRQKKYFEKLYFWSIFLDEKYKSELENPILRTGIKLSLPILRKIATSKISSFE